jgi:hypothetical protein
MAAEVSRSSKNEGILKLPNIKHSPKLNERYAVGKKRSVGSELDDENGALF